MVDKTYKYYCPLDFVIETEKLIGGDWTNSRGQACTGPWANFGYYFLHQDVISDSEIECSIGSAKIIRVIESKRRWRINNRKFSEAVGMPVDSLISALNESEMNEDEPNF